jgi:acyl-CoA thioesterase I
MSSHLNTKQIVEYLFAGILLSVFIYPANAQAYKVRMAFIGNSITYGATLKNPATDSYPAQLGKMLSGVYGDTVEIKNAGVSARTMLKHADNPIWIEPPFKSALKFVPDICLVCLGTNDSRPFIWDEWGDEFLADYLSMIDTFKFRNPYTRFIICHPTPIWEGHPYGTNFSNSHNDSVLVNHIIPLIDSVAKLTGAILVDFHTPFTDSLNLFPDKLHPDLEGSRQIAEILFDRIIKEDLVHQVEPGLAFISVFIQVKSPISVGSTAELKWTTIYADSVFLDGVPVEKSGSYKVIAEEGLAYNLTAKGPKNTSVFPLVLTTYIAEKSGLKINPSSGDYSNGKPVTLYSIYTDQLGREMPENTSNVSWTIVEGDGKLGDQTDTSIVFTPVSLGRVLIGASEGDLSKNLDLYVNSLPSAVRNSNTENMKVYPNPVNEKVCFEFSNIPGHPVQIRVNDVLGKQIIERNLDNPNQAVLRFELNTSGLDKGIYVYAVYFGTEVMFGRFLK